MSCNDTENVPSTTQGGEWTPLDIFLMSFQLVSMPILTVFSICLLVTVYLIEDLHTPNNYILCAIAMLDLNIGILFSSFQVATHVPSQLVQSNRWSCAFHFTNASFCATAGLDLLTVLCVDRFLRMYNPLWYIVTVSGRKIVSVMAGVISARLASHLAAFVYELVTHDGDLEWTKDLCVALHAIPIEMLNVNTCFMIAEMLVCCTLNVAVVNLYFKVESRKYIHDEAKRDVIRLSSLVIPSIILWLPSLVHRSLFLVSNDDSTTHQERLTDVARLCRLINAGLHGPIWAATGKIYRHSFKFLLTTCPRRWSHLQNHLRRKSDLRHKLRDTKIKLSVLIPAVYAMKGAERNEMYAHLWDGLTCNIHAPSETMVNAKTKQSATAFCIVEPLTEMRVLMTPLKDMDRLLHGRPRSVSETFSDDQTSSVDFLKSSRFSRVDKPRASFLHHQHTMHGRPRSASETSSVDQTFSEAQATSRYSKSPRSSPRASFLHQQTGIILESEGAED